MTCDLTREKNCLPSKTADVSLSSVQDLVTFARNIPDLLASLPVSLVIDDESLSETTTNQLTGILHRYGHDLEKATTKKLQVLDANLCLTRFNVLAAAFESQVCENCKGFEGLRVTSKTEVKAGVYAFDLFCKTCYAKSSRVSDSRIIESKFRPKSWGVFHLQKISENFYWEFPFGKSAFHLPQVPFEEAEGRLAA